MSDRRREERLKKLKRKRMLLILAMALGMALILGIGFMVSRLIFAKGSAVEETTPAVTESLPTEETVTVLPTTEAPTEPVSTYNENDKTPPEGKAVEKLTLWDCEEIKPEFFVESMEDDTKITLAFGREPDKSKIGETQDIEVVLTDEGGNQTILTSSLELKHDDVPPVIKGAYNMTVYMGDTILYRKGVEVTDNQDENVKLTIDSSQVDRNKEGTYNVTYTAEDKSGNVAETTIFIKVMEKVAVTEEMVNELADRILSQIFTEGMGNREKAYAIYLWTRKSIAYTGHTDPSNIWVGAYQGLRYRAGDCFTYCATAHVLYQRAGFQVMKIDRNAGYLRHYWNYVNYGEGWYHCDSSLHQSDGFEPFMLTTGQMVEYTTNVMNRPDYYLYDTAAYPPCGNGEGETAPEGEEPSAEGETSGEGEPQSSGETSGAADPEGGAAGDEIETTPETPAP